MEILQRLAAVFFLTLFCCSSMTKEEVTLTCDLQDYAQLLTCDDGVIAVQNVEVSHRETEVCVNGVRPDHLEAPLCSSTPLLDIVKKSCDGKRACSVPMDSCHSARPCLTRCFWMETTYTCEARRIHHVCQKNMTMLHCESQVIKVIMANYGRTSRTVCEYSAPCSQLPSTNCILHNTLQVMADRCDGKHKCSVRASNLIFSDPCPGTFKYLEFSYTCVNPGNSEE